MITPETRLKIAVFIDFDNIEIGVKSTIGQQFDIGLVLEAIKERGEIVTKIADMARTSLERSQEGAQSVDQVVNAITLISGASPFCQTFFDDVLVPKQNLPGQELYPDRYSTCFAPATWISRPRVTGRDCCSPTEAGSTTSPVRITLRIQFQPLDGRRWSAIIRRWLASVSC